MKTQITKYGGYILAGVILIFLLQLCNVKNGVISTLENQVLEQPETYTVYRVDTVHFVKEVKKYIKVYQNSPADTVTLIQLIADTNMIVRVDSIDTDDLWAKYTIYSYCPITAFMFDHKVKCPPNIRETVTITNNIPDDKYHIWGGVMTDQAKFYGLTASVSKRRLNLGVGYLFNNKFIGTVQYKIR